MKSHFRFLFVIVWCSALSVLPLSSVFSQNFSSSSEYWTQERSASSSYMSLLPHRDTIDLREVDSPLEMVYHLEQMPLMYERGWRGYCLVETLWFDQLQFEFYDSFRVVTWEGGLSSFECTSPKYRILDEFMVGTPVQVVRDLQNVRRYGKILRDHQGVMEIEYDGGKLTICHKDGYITSYSYDSPHSPFLVEPDIAQQLDRPYTLYLDKVKDDLEYTDGVVNLSSVRTPIEFVMKMGLPLEYYHGGGMPNEGYGVNETLDYGDWDVEFISGDRYTVSGTTGDVMLIDGLKVGNHISSILEKSGKKERVWVLSSGPVLNKDGWEQYVFYIYDSRIYISCKNGIIVSFSTWFPV